MVSSDTVLEAVLEWARAERHADDCGAESNTFELAARSDASATRRADAALRLACRDADQAEGMMRDLALTFIGQEDDSR